MSTLMWEKRMESANDLLCRFMMFPSPNTIFSLDWEKGAALNNTGYVRNPVLHIGFFSPVSSNAAYTQVSVPTTMIEKDLIILIVSGVIQACEQECAAAMNNTKLSPDIKKEIKSFLRFMLKRKKTLDTLVNFRALVDGIK